MLFTNSQNNIVSASVPSVVTSQGEAEKLSFERRSLWISEIILI